MERRQVKPVSYNLVKRKKAKTSDQRPCRAFVYISQFSKRVEQRHLIIDDALFIHNGRPYEGQEFATYKCRIADCHCRAKIAYTNLQKLGNQDAFVNGSHGHPLNSVKELKLARGGFTREGEQIQFVPASIELPLPPKSHSDLDKMLVSDIQLSRREEQHFEGKYHEDQINGKVLGRSYYETLRVGQAEKFNLGVFATEEIPKGSFLGFFFGRLCRVLAEKPRYSFNVSVPGEKEELHVNAENSCERNKLA